LIRSPQRIEDALVAVWLVERYLDEVEKAFSGVSSSVQTDSGVSARLFGSFLSWLNDHESDVFVVATANDITKLPPEFARAERFDSVFFLDLPGAEQRAGIWQIYVGLYRLDAKQKLPLDSDWTGAEIKACCRLSALLDMLLRYGQSPSGSHHPDSMTVGLQCPLAFKLRYIDGVRLPATASQLIGKHVHAGLEQWYRHRQLGLPLTPAEMLSRHDATWEEAAQAEQIAFESVADEAEARQQVRALLTAYLSSVPQDDPLPVAVETRLTAPLIDPANGEDLGVPLLGIVDLVLAEQTGPIVVDLKTSSRSDGAQEIQHEVQLTSYSYLIRETAGQLESGLEIRSLVKTKTPKIERQRYQRRQERHFRRFFAVLREYFDALDRGRYSYCPGWSCQACALRDSHCQAWDG